MTDEQHYRDVTWAERNASAPHVNALRRAWFESVKAAIGEANLPKSVINPPPPCNIIAWPIHTMDGLFHAGE